MTIIEYRKNHAKLTLEEFARQLGLNSKGQMSEVERSGKCSVAIALAIEKHSAGRINAADLNADVAASRAGIAA